MILKAACVNNPCYIDRLITSFMRVLQRMAREHLVPSSPDLSSVASELLILSLDLVKNRVGVMSPDMRKAFIGSILVGLIDKTQDNKVMKAILKMVDDWVKTKVRDTSKKNTLLFICLFVGSRKRVLIEYKINDLRKTEQNEHKRGANENPNGM